MNVTNPIVRGYAPDPSICRVGNDFYLVNSSCEYFPGVPIRHSRDLVNWSLIGHCLTTATQVPLASARSSQGIYAPTLRYHEGRFFMVTTNVGGGGNFIVHTNEIEGPWSEPIYLPIEGIDPSLFWDEDGTCYLTSQSSSGVQQVVIDPLTGEFSGEPKVIWGGTGGQWPEGPHLFRREGMYYLTIAEGGTEYGHMQTIARANSQWGPFEPCPRNPILTHRSLASQFHALGHADFFQDTRGGWWLVCLGIRPNGYPYAHHLGRETFLCPVTWDDDGWPIVGHHGTAPVDLELPVDRVESDGWRDDFDASISPEWSFIRNPNTTLYSLDERAGHLVLTGTNTGLGEVGSPSWIGRPQRNFGMTFEASFEATLNAGDEVGISIRMNEQHRYELFATKDRVQVRQTIGDLTQITASSPLRSTWPFRLRVTSDVETYRFWYSQGEDYLQLGTAKTRYLATEVAGGFTGVMLGLYAYSPTSSGYAEIDWCEYKPIS